MDYYITKYDVEIGQGGECVVLEDSIMHKGRLATAGSKMLESFISPIDATVVTRLEAAGIRILGKTMMDEFGIAGLLPSNRADTKTATIPNSECGAVAAVAEGAASFALCNDYTGDIGRQAAAKGLCYLHPTYGTVSRYGLIPAASSMDQIGIVCKTPADGERILSIIRGNDSNDGAMFPNSEFGIRNMELSVDRIKIGVPMNVIGEAGGHSAIDEFVKGFEIVEFELEHFEVFAQVMQILCFAEISGNLSRYDGIKFGYRAEAINDLHELYTKTRTEAFGIGIKLAAIMGMMVLSHENYERYYDKAMKIRRLIKDSLSFDKYDAIIMPLAGGQKDARPALCALPRLCGLPAMTVPASDGGFALVADANREDVLFAALGKVTI